MQTVWNQKIWPHDKLPTVCAKSLFCVDNDSRKFGLMTKYMLWNCEKLWETVRNCEKLWETVRSCEKLWETVRNHSSVQKARLCLKWQHANYILGRKLCVKSLIKKLGSDSIKNNHMRNYKLWNCVWNYSTMQKRWIHKNIHVTLCWGTPCKNYSSLETVKSQNLTGFKKWRERHFA